MKSTDLKHWTLVGNFLAHELPDVTIGEDISCPNFFPLGDKWMLLCISHPLGCRYYIGDWDAQAEQFVPKQHGRMNWRRDEQPIFGLFRRTDFFAPESVLTPDGRRVMWAWLTSAGPDNRLRNKTIQSLPRELSLPVDGVLRIAPLRELESLRYDPVTLSNVELATPVTGHGAQVPPTAAPQLQRIAELSRDAVELRIAVAREQVARKLLGFVLFSDGKGGGLPVLLRPETAMLRVGTTEAPFDLEDVPASEDVEIRIFVDNYLVEVFAGSRQALVAAHFQDQRRTGLDAFTVGAPTTLKKVEIWKLKPTNEGFLEARANRIWEPQME
jgi:sucrose-6-phosphate hydrolase SacC (GH32 family)